MPPAIVAQLSDLHVMAPGARLDGVLDTNASARAAVAAVNAFEPAVAVVAVTGDVTEDGGADAYAEARRILDELRMPYWSIPGNHDRRAAFVDAFAGRCREHDGRVSYTVDDAALRLVALDSLVEGEEHGELGAAQLAWLDDELSAAPDRPTMVLVHHPPFDTGVWWMDTARLADADAFGRVVAAHPNVVHVACGHVHRPVHRAWCGTAVSIAPSTAYAVGLELGHEARPTAVLGPPALHLHAFDGTSVVTHLVPVGDASPVLDISGSDDDWPAQKQAWRDRAAKLS